MANDDRDAMNKLCELIKDVQFCMMTTALPDGTLRSRPMATQSEAFDGEALWFFTAAESGKVHEIRDDQHVNLAYADVDKNHYVSVAGRAAIVRDRELIDRYWQPTLRAWFPQGKDDPSVALIRVTPESAEYWDSPSSKVVQLYGMAKATLTGRPPKGGEHDSVQFPTTHA